MSQPEKLVIPQELEDALVSMIRNKHNGEIVVQFKQGGVAGVKKTIVCK